MSLPILLTIIGILLFFQFIWLVIDDRPLFQIIKESSNRRLRATYRYVFLVLVMQLFCSFLFPVDLGVLNPVVSVIGISLYEIGISIAIWAKVTMKENWGRPGLHDIKKQKELVTTGPFTYTRNPIYMGLLLMTLGFSIALKSYLCILIVPLFFYIREIIFLEEEQLETFFDKKFKEYKNKVHRYI